MDHSRPKVKLRYLHRFVNCIASFVPLFLLPNPHPYIKGSLLLPPFHNSPKYLTSLRLLNPSHLQPMSETPPMSLSRSPPADASCATDMKVERTSYGIFEVAYERPPQRLSLRHFADAINSLLEPLPFVVRLFQDLFSLAPLTFVSYGAASFWEALAPALSVYFSKLVLDHVSSEVLYHDLTRADKFTG